MCADRGGVVQERYAYSAYGASTALTAAFVLRGDSDYAWEARYAGDQRDNESSMFCVRNRFYDPCISSWITRDPLEIRSGDTNAYQMLVSSPLNMLDPFGLDVWGWIFPGFDQHLWGYMGGGQIAQWHEHLPSCPPVSPGKAAVTFGDGWCSEGANPYHSTSDECFRSYPLALAKCVHSCKGRYRQQLIAQCVRKFPPGPGQQCCYCRGRLVRDSLAGTPDKVGFAVGENKDGTCISDPILQVLYHGIVDVLPDYIMSHEDYLREWPPSR